MLGDGQFGVCLIDQKNLVNGWNAPKLTGTIAKITQCEDVDLDGLQLHIETLGRNKFKINKIIPPSLAPPKNYDPHTVEGHKIIFDMHEKVGTDEKMYIRAEVEMIPEIDDSISLEKWQKLVSLWKSKIIKQAHPHTVESHTLDHVLEKYYLTTDLPTIDYIYSLSALGAKDPNDLQPILEAHTIDDLLEKVEELMTVK
jgi:Lon protease-like protein